MKKRVNRHNRKEYNQIRLEGLSEIRAEADRIACIVLAVAYSRTHGDIPSVQRLIQMGCVAACFVGDAIWLASNNVEILPVDIDNALGNDYNGRTVWIVQNGNGNMHAEMQLVQELHNDSCLYRGVYIGVSKPCCEQCANLLDKLGISYLHWHDDRVVHWESPNL